MLTNKYISLLESVGFYHYCICVWLERHWYGGRITYFSLWRMHCMYTILRGAKVHTSVPQHLQYSIDAESQVWFQDAFKHKWKSSFIHHESPILQFHFTLITLPCFFAGNNELKHATIFHPIPRYCIYFYQWMVLNLLTSEKWNKWYVVYYNSCILCYMRQHVFMELFMWKVLLISYM